MFDYDANEPTENKWNQVEQTLIGGDNANLKDRMGFAVDISSDGSRILAYGSMYGRGRTRIFDLVGNVWTQHGGDILGWSDGNNGESSVISGDGSTVVIDNEYFNNYRGQVRVFEYGPSMSCIPLLKCDQQKGRHLCRCIGAGCCHRILCCILQSTQTRVLRCRVRLELSRLWVSSTKYLYF